LAGAAQAETRIGMITTLSGGGAALGLDVRDGFLLAIAQSGRDDVEVIVADDEQAPDVAVQLADRMVQSDDVDILTGIIWSNLAMAVIPSVTAQGLFYLSPNAGPSQLAGRGCHPNYFNVAWQNDNLHEAAGAYANSAGYTNSFILAPNYPAGRTRWRATSASTRAGLRARSTPSLARPITPPRSRRSARPGPTACSSSCPAAWGFRSCANMPTAAWTSQ
jgi:ABC-type branched-subunit amino acid transport system substrate-binding protein